MGHEVHARVPSQKRKKSTGYVTNNHKVWEEFLPNSIKNTNVKWYLFKHDENTKNIHYLVPLSVKFYQIFIFTYDFDTDLFLSTSCSQLISGESLVSFIHSTHIHMRAFALIPPKKTWNCNFFLNFIFFNLLFQKSALHWKKSKQMFDITAW